MILSLPSLTRRRRAIFPPDTHDHGRVTPNVNAFTIDAAKLTVTVAAQLEARASARLSSDKMEK